MDIFNYIPFVVAIRNEDFTPILTLKTVTDTDKINIHKRLLCTLAVLGAPCALVFENEIYLTRSLVDLMHNEIKTFVTTNMSWDIIILSEYHGFSTENVSGYNFIEKIKDTTTFPHEQIYIASSRFMQKVQSNQLMTDIQVYTYNSPFVANLKTQCKSNKYSIGRITNITTLGDTEIKYKWNEIVLV